MKHLLKPGSSCLKAPCNDLARGFFLSATRLFYRIALIYYQFTFGDTSALSGECRQGFLIKNQGEIHETTTPKPSLRRVGNDALFLHPDFVYGGCYGQVMHIEKK